MRILKRRYVPAAITLLCGLSLIGCQGDEGSEALYPER